MKRSVPAGLVLETEERAAPKSYFLDIFHPTEWGRAKRVCSVKIAPSTVEAWDLFRAEDPKVADFADRVRAKLKNGRAEDRFVDEQLETALVNGCAPPKAVLAPYNYVCFRKGNLTDQGQRTIYFSQDPTAAYSAGFINPCFALIPKANKRVLLAPAWAEYLQRGAYIRLEAVQPVKIRWIDLRGEQVPLDAGIASEIKQLNQAGFVTTFSCSGLLADHYVRETEPAWGYPYGYITFAVPVGKKDSFTACMRETATESGSQMEMGKGTVTIQFFHNTISRIGYPAEYDRHLKARIRKFVSTLIAKRC